MMRYKFIIIAILLLNAAYAQKKIVDESVRYQQERMVFKQWDQNKFTPTSGFLGLNPYYWLTWGLMPSYKKTDLRPLSGSGEQTQRLSIVGVMNTTDGAYKLESDTIRNTALLETGNQLGTISAADPLWIMYYSKEFKPLLENSVNTILSPLPADVREKVISEGLYSWFKNELDMLKERLDGAHSSTLDRGARILAYHRMLLEYRHLNQVWATRTSGVRKTVSMTNGQQKVRSNQITIDTWSSDSDIKIANDVIRNKQY